MVRTSASAAKLISREVVVVARRNHGRRAAHELAVGKLRVLEREAGFGHDHAAFANLVALAMHHRARHDVEDLVGDHDATDLVRQRVDPDEAIDVAGMALLRSARAGAGADRGSPRAASSDRGACPAPSAPSKRSTAKMPEPGPSSRMSPPPIFLRTCPACSAKQRANMGEISGEVTKSPSSPNLRAPPRSSPSPGA